MFNPGVTNGCTSLGEASSLSCAPNESETAPHFCLLGRIRAQHGGPPAGTSVAGSAEAHGTPFRQGVVVALHLQKMNFFSSGMTPSGGHQNSRFSYGNGGPIAPSRHVLGILMFQMFSPSPALLEAHGGFVWPFAPGKPPKLEVLNK